MAIKGGSIIHAGNGVTVIDRIQNAGPGQVNIPTEKIYELGNYKSVATVRDTPDLQFSVNSLDVSTEIEALLTGQYGGRAVDDGGIAAAATTLTSATAAFAADDAGRQVIVYGAGAGGADLVTTIDTVTDATTAELADAAGTTVADAHVIITTNGFDLSLAKPVDIASQFKAGTKADDPFKVVDSVALPFLYLSSMQYAFGLHDNASQQGQLSGDTIFYNPGACFVETTAGTGAAGQTVVTAHPAYQLSEADQRRVLAVTAGATRLALGVDYTESYGTVNGGAAVTTITLVNAVAAEDDIRIIYSSPDALEYPQSVHPDTTVKPAAVKGRDIEIYIGGYDPNDRPGSAANKLRSVQSVTWGWSVTLEKDEELGNYFATGIDFEVPDVKGTVAIKPADADALLALIRKAAGVTDAKKVLGTATSVPVALDIVILDANNKSRPIKRLHCDDARFTPPGYNGQVQQQLQVTLNWDSDEGGMLVFAA